MPGLDIAPRRISGNGSKLTMKNLTLIFTICLLVIPDAVSAQCGKRQFYGKAGITFSPFGDNSVFRFTELEGAAGFEGTGFHSLGINYIVSLNRWIESETGLEYSKHNLVITSAPNPEIDNPPLESGLSLITVPLSLRANFLRYFFVTPSQPFTTHSFCPDQEKEIPPRKRQGPRPRCRIYWDQDPGEGKYPKR